MVFIIVQLILLVGCLFFSGFFSSSEVALFSLPGAKVKVFKKESDPRKQLVAKLLASPRDLLVTIIMFNIIINILIQNITSNLFGDFSGWELTIGVPLILTLVFGEVIPKSIGMAHNEALSYRIAPFLQLAQTLIIPFRKVLIGVTSLFSRLFFFFLRSEKEISFDELQHTLRTSRRFGILNEEEAELIRGFLILQESQVKELMRPREEVLYYDVDEPLSKLLYLFIDKQCTRLPVCRGSLDNILGVISSQIYFLHKEEIKNSSDLLTLIKKSFFAPEGMSAEVLLRKMYENQESLALIVDEYGSISGLTALEDLVEKVVGEIADARDTKSRYTRSGEDVIIASGKMELLEFESIFNHMLYSENHMVTLGGWLTEKLGDIPKAGVKYEAHGFLFHVLAADAKRIRRIYVRKLGGKQP